jgi:cytidine deaminase
MAKNSLLVEAREVGLTHADSLSGENFATGAAFRFSNGQVLAGASSICKPDVGFSQCVEDFTLAMANREIGPLANGRNVDGLRWQELALWSQMPSPAISCGTCRDILAASSFSTAEIVSRGECGSREIVTTMAELLPLAGRGLNGDVRVEIQNWKSRGANISSELSPTQQELLVRARSAAEMLKGVGKSSGLATGVAIQLFSGDGVVIGRCLEEGTGLFRNSAIADAIGTLQAKHAEQSGIAAVSFFTNANVLRAPSGQDLELLSGLAVRKDIPVIFASADCAGYCAPLETCFQVSQKLRLSSLFYERIPATRS